MIRSVRAELLKLRRPGVILGGTGAFVLFAVLTTVLTFATAKPDPGRFSVGTTPATSLRRLAEAPGLTRGFQITAGFLGLLVFVLFLTSVTGEYSRGTLRALLTRQPSRTRLLGSKLLALAACTAVALAVAEIASAGVAVPMAHLRGVSTSSWFTAAGLWHAAVDYRNALLAEICYGTLGACLGILVRSTPIALGIGIAWLGPIEHITQFSWSDAERWFPGLLLDALPTGGTTLVPYHRALLAAAIAIPLAFTFAAVTFIRRDVSD